MARLQGNSGFVVAAFVGLIITAVLIGSFADRVTEQTQTVIVYNATHAAPSVANTSVKIPGRGLTTDITWEVTNTTEAGDPIDADCLYLADGKASDGTLSVQLWLNGSDLQATGGCGHEGADVDMSYGYEPDGYITTTGGRGIANLVILMSAIAMVVFTITMFLKAGLKNLIEGFR